MQIDPVLLEMDRASSGEASNSLCFGSDFSTGISTGTMPNGSALGHPNRSTINPQGGGLISKRAIRAVSDEETHDVEHTKVAQAKRQKLNHADANVNVSQPNNDCIGKQFYIGSLIGEPRIPIIASLLTNGNWRLKVGDVKPEYHGIWEDIKRQRKVVGIDGVVATENVELCPLVFKDVTIFNSRSLSPRTRKRRLIRQFLILATMSPPIGIANNWQNKEFAGSQPQDNIPNLSIFLEPRPTVNDSGINDAPRPEECKLQEHGLYRVGTDISQDYAGIHIGFLKTDLEAPVYAYVVGEKSGSAEANSGSNQTMRFCVVAKGPHAFNETKSTDVDLGDVAMNPEFDRGSNNMSRNYFWDLLYRSSQALRERNSILNDSENTIPGYQGISNPLMGKLNIPNAYFSSRVAVNESNIVHEEQVAQISARLDTDTDNVHRDTLDTTIVQSQMSLEEVPSEYQRDPEDLGAQNIIMKDCQTRTLTAETTSARQEAEIGQMKLVIQNLQCEIIQSKNSRDNMNTQQADTMVELESYNQELQSTSRVHEQEIARLKETITEKGKERAWAIRERDETIARLQNILDEKDKETRIQADEVKELKEVVVTACLAARKKDGEILRLENIAKGREEKIVHLTNLVGAKDAELKEKGNESAQLMLVMDEEMKEKDKLIGNIRLVAQTKDKEMDHAQNLLRKQEEKIASLESMMEAKDGALKVKDDLVASLQIAVQASDKERIAAETRAKEREDDIAGLKILVAAKENEKYEAIWEKERVVQGLKENDKAIKAKAGKVVLPKTGAKKDEMIIKQAGQLKVYHEDWSTAKNEHYEEIRHLEEEHARAMLRHREEVQSLKDEIRAVKKR